MPVKNIAGKFNLEKDRYGIVFLTPTRENKTVADFQFIKGKWTYCIWLKAQKLGYSINKGAHDTRTSPGKDAYYFLPENGVEVCKDGITVVITKEDLENW